MDAPTHDWRMYYENTYMRHIEKGPMLISIKNNDSGTQSMLGYQVLKNGQAQSKFEKINPQDVRIMWPRPGAYNIAGSNCGVFVGRQPQRHMKRSASFEHYFLTWSPQNIPMTHQILKMIVVPAPYSRLDTLVLQLRNVKVLSGALSIRVCLGIAGQSVEVIYMAEGIGLLDDENRLIPYMADDSRLARFKKHLLTVGIR